MDSNNSTTQVTFPKFPWDINVCQMSRERFVQECAIILYGNVDFARSTIPVTSVAKDCVDKANILANELGL